MLAMALRRPSLRRVTSSRIGHKTARIDLRCTPRLYRSKPVHALQKIFWKMRYAFFLTHQNLLADQFFDVVRFIRF